MPLTDLIRYFNAADSAEDSMLYLDGERAAAWHKGLRLGSLFQPIVDLRLERVVGHQATLDARREDGSPVSSEAVYAWCETAEAVVPCMRSISWRNGAMPAAICSLPSIPATCRPSRASTGWFMKRSSSAAAWRRPISCSTSTFARSVTSRLWPSP